MYEYFYELCFETKLKMLTQMWVAENLDPETKILVFRELINLLKAEELFRDTMADVIRDLREHHRRLTISGNAHLIFKYADFFETWVVNPKRKTIYHNSENVHSFVKSASHAAREIMTKYPFEENRRALFEHEAFARLKIFEPVNGICLNDLLASVWAYICSRDDETRSEMTLRLVQEMDDSVDACAVGVMVRLVNCVRGYDEDGVFEFDLDKFEYEKSFIFHVLNKTLAAEEFTDLEDFPKNVEKAINLESVKREIFSKDISATTVLNVLKDYTKSNGTWKFLKNSFVLK
jgi:hypothetical protein